MWSFRSYSREVNIENKACWNFNNIFAFFDLNCTVFSPNWIISFHIFINSSSFQEVVMYRYLKWKWSEIFQMVIQTVILHFLIPREFSESRTSPTINRTSNMISRNSADLISPTALYILVLNVVGCFSHGGAWLIGSCVNNGKLKGLGSVRCALDRIY